MGSPVAQLVKHAALSTDAVSSPRWPVIQLDRLALCCMSSPRISSSVTSLSNKGTKKGLKNIYIFFLKVAH